MKKARKDLTSIISLRVALLGAFVLVLSGCAGTDRQRPGLVGEYFSMNEIVSDFPVVQPDKIPTLKRVDPAVNFECTKGDFYGTGLIERFYVRWSGVIKTPSSGTYTFYTESDDASRLFIDGKLVVDNYGLHAMQEEEGDVELARGTHRIKVEFIQYDGAAGCICRWKTPSGARETIPSEVFTHFSREEDPLVRTAVAEEVNKKTDTAPPEPAESASLEEKVNSVLPRPEENRWQGIQWRRNLHEARMESQVLGRPLFLWIMNGNPQGCT